MSVRLCSFISLFVVYLSVSVRLSSVRLSVRPFLCPSVSLSVSICSSLCPFICHLSASLSIRLSSVRFSVRPFLCPSVSLIVSVRSSVTCPSLCSHVLRFLSRALVDPVVYCNLSYNVLSLWPAQPAPVSGGQVLLCACSWLFLGVYIGDPMARLVKRLGAVDTNKEVLIVWSRVTVLRPAARPTATCQFNYKWHVNGIATVLIFNKQQSGLNLVSNLLLFFCKFVDFH